MFRLDGVGGPQRSAGLGLFKPEPLVVVQKSNGTQQTMTVHEARGRGFNVMDAYSAVKQFFAVIFSDFFDRETNNKDL